MKAPNRVGYLGGTFDPPHLGHEIIAGAALEQLDLDALMWLITPAPPHKTDREITPIKSRLEMLSLIVNKHGDYHISEVDLVRQPPYYAADTVEIIKSQQPDGELVYIIGEDSLEDLPDWHQPDRFLAAIDQLAVAPRPAYAADLAVIESKLVGIKQKTVYLKGILVEISSSMIRKQIRRGAAYDQFVSPDIAGYIERNQLYRG